MFTLQLLTLEWSTNIITSCYNGNIFGNNSNIYGNNANNANNGNIYGNNSNNANILVTMVTMVTFFRS